MKLLMDSDCLIKLVKSSLKEIVCRSFSIVIPSIVKKEVVDDSAEQPDAMIVEKNIESKQIMVTPALRENSKGEEAVFAAFESGKYDAICSDDKRFIKGLRMFQVPYITPAVIVAVMLKEGKISAKEALQKIESLAPMISDEEYLTVKAFLTNWK